MTQPIGVKLPIVRGNTGYFDQSFTTLEQARANLINLLLTNRGERPMQPELGTDIYRLLFENLTSNTATLIEQNIRQSVGFWLPYVIINQVEVDIGEENIDQNRIDISLTFSLTQDPTINETITLRFQQ